MPGQGGDNWFFVWAVGTGHAFSMNCIRYARLVHKCVGQGLGMGLVRLYTFDIQINKINERVAVLKSSPVVAVAVGKMGRVSVALDRRTSRTVS